jgi:hypothetical protein
MSLIMRDAVLYECGVCGCAVADIDQHRQWCRMVEALALVTAETAPRQLPWRRWLRWPR